jgi:HK97 family phage major capsid protein
VYGRFIMSLVESTAVLRAGATLVQTATGNELLVPRLTGYSTAALVAEGQTITQSEPTLDVLSLGAYKYGVTFQISREMADDSPLALQDVLFRNAAQALVSAYGPKLILGNGTTEPQGLVTAGTVGKQGPAGTSTSLGTQGTAGQGTDFVADMEASVNDAYIMRGPVWLMNNTSRTAFRKLQDGQKRPIYDLRPNVPGASADVDGYPLYVEPGFANMGISAKFAAFGDPSVYIVRIVNGIRFERSDEFAFTSDLVTFKAVARLDAGLADTAGLKIMQNAAS